MRTRKAGAAAAALAMLSAAAIGAVTQAGTAAAATRPAALPAACAKPLDPYSTPTSVLTSCGEKVESLQAVTSLPGGGKAYSYGDYTINMPPAHFNLLTASDAQLAAYGLPTRKQLGAQWTQVMSAARSFTPVPAYLVEDPTVKPDTDVAASVPGTAAASWPSTSSNWSGYYVHGHTYNEVTTSWIEPHFVGHGCHGDDFGSWAGIGGVKGANDLAQTGTAFNYPHWVAHQGWIETISNGSGPPVAIKGFVPRAGNKVYASVLWEGNGHFSYFMENMTTGQITPPLESRRVSANRSTAEVIAERPGPELSDFKTLSVMDATAYWSNGAQGFHGGTHVAVTMFQGRTKIAVPSSLSSKSNFSVAFKGCG